MDFLDPKKKRARKVRLAIGHVLTAMLVLIATYILVFQAYGYEVDKNGQVIQNGLVYIDSAPSGASIKINGKEHGSNTNTRQALPEGRYDLEISKQGYHTWSRSFELEGGEVLRFTYPFLVPNSLTPAELQAFDGSIGFSTQSPSRKWVVLGQKNNLSTMTVFDIEKRVDEKPTSAVVTWPAGLFTPAAGDHTIKLVEWSTDNRHILVQHNWAGGQEFVMLDREQPAQSYNVNTTLNQAPSKVSLFDKNFEKLFLYDANSKVLSLADVKTKVIQTYANNVASYKSHGDDTVLMAIADAQNKDKANVIMRQNDKNYTLREIPIADNIPLDIARYEGAWYIAISVQSEQKTYVYKNPMDLINSQNGIKSARAIILRNTGPIDQVSFSQNTRFIMSSSGQNFSVYDAESERRYSYNINQPFDPAQKPAWMDGHRIMANSAGKVVIFDFDGINQQTLVSNDPAVLPMFDRDYTEIYTLGASAASPGKYGLFLTELRLEADR